MSIQDRSVYLLGLCWPALLGLTPGLSAGGQVYMTRTQALQRAFPEAKSFLERRHVLAKKEKALLEKKLQRKLAERGYLCWLALDAKDRPLGFVVMTAEVGRTEPFFLMLALDCKGSLRHLDVLEYREPRGSEVRHQTFLRRFRGVDRQNVVRKLRRMPVIPGATLSCHAVNRAVKKALVLHEIYLQQSHEKGAPQQLLDVFRKAKARRVPVPKKKPIPKGTRREARSAGHAERTSFRQPAMGDVVFVDLASAQPETRMREVLAVISTVEQQLSPRIAGSLTARANALGEGERLDLDSWPLGALAIQAAWTGSQDSSGRFSPVPDRSRPDLAFQLLEQGRVLHRVGPGDLDPGAFGKGFAADLLVAALDAAGISWTAAGFRSSFVLADPRGLHVAISTSGNQQRGAHIRDPRTGASILRSEQVQVMARTAIEAEIWSTAWFVEDDTVDPSI